MPDLLAYLLVGVTLGFPLGATLADLTRDVHWRRP